MTIYARELDYTRNEWKNAVYIHKTDFCFFIYFFCCFWKLLEFKHLTRTTIHLECVVCARALVFGWMRCFCLKLQVLYIDFIYARRILFTRKGTLHQFIKFTNQYYDATIQIGIYNSCDTRVM